MLKTMFAGAVALGALVGTAEAASPPPLYDWTGFYVGAFGGGLGGRTYEYASGPSGLDAGLTFSYSWQAHGNWVFTPFVAVPLIHQTGEDSGFDTRIDWAVAAGLKLGVAMGRWQPYALVGGLVAGGSADDGGPTESNTHSGIMFGLGAEYALTDRVSIGGRFVHIAVGEKEYFSVDRGWSGNSIAATVNFKLK
jgi:opacity protein-like surface antigen